MKKIFVLIVFLYTQVTSIHSAELFLVQTRDVYSGSVSFDVMLDPEGEQINAFSGVVTIPEEMFDVAQIETTGSVAPLWIKQPHVLTKEDSFSFVTNKKNIFFEGVIPGGFDGVRSPYYKGKRAGKIFSFILVPKKSGTASISFDLVKILRNDGKATPAFVITQGMSIFVPDLKTLPTIQTDETEKDIVYQEATEKTLDVYVVKDNDIAKGKWVVLLEDDLTRHTPKMYRIAESNSAITRSVPFYEWKNAVSPYILLYQKRDRFIHVQALYTDGTRTTKIIPPVENKGDDIRFWRILVGIAIVVVIVRLLPKIHVLKKHLSKTKHAS